MKNPIIYQKIDGYTLAQQAKNLGLYPYFRTIASELDTEVVLADGRRLLMFGSNNYLGLTNHPEIKEAAMNAVRKYGTGCAGSRFLNGSLDIHEETEAELADWTGKDAAIIYPAGFMVNQGVISVLLDRSGHILIDTLNHASIYDGARLSMAKIHRYPHNDMAGLESCLKRTPANKGRLIVTDAVFSMEGDLANLPDLVRLAQTHQAAVMVDDAHGLGVMSADGSGTAAHFGLTEDIDFIMGTFSKSLASNGGFITADTPAIEFIKHHSRALIFSASMPPPCTASVLAAVRLIRREPDRIARLWRNTRLMHRGLVACGFDTGRSETPIIPVYVDGPETLVQLWKEVEDKGLFVNPVIPPAVPANHSMLRISLMATHTRSQIERAVEVLGAAGRKLGIV